MRDLRDVQQDQIAALESRLESAKETIRQLRADLTTAQRRYDELAAATGLHPSVSLTNREHGYLDRIKDRCEILRARLKSNPHRAHYVIDWERELKALEWAVARLEPQKEKS